MALVKHMRTFPTHISSVAVETTAKFIRMFIWQFLRAIILHHSKFEMAYSKRMLTSVRVEIRKLERSFLYF